MPIPVVVEAGFGVVVFRAEAEGEDVGHRARLRDGAAEGVVGVGGHDLARLGDVVRDVAVVVVEREVPHAVHFGREEAADAARAVERAGEVAPPDVVDEVVGAGVARAPPFQHEAPAAVGEVAVCRRSVARGGRLEPATLLGIVFGLRFDVTFGRPSNFTKQVVVSSLCCLHYHVA